MSALVFSISASADGFVADRDGDLSWGVPDEELFRCHTEQVRGLGAYLLGRRLYETMRVWETDPAMRRTADDAAFADAWAALPKVVFSTTLDRVEGRARLADAPLAEEVARALAEHDRDVAIGGPTLAGQALELDLVDELHIFRNPVLLGGGLRHLPELDRPLAFELVGTRTFGSRVVLERLRRVRADAA
jgi:dihydrofolate reductase